MAWQRRAEDGVRAGLAARSPMGVRLVIEPLGPLVRESGRADKITTRHLMPR